MLRANYPTCCCTQAHNVNAHCNLHYVVVVTFMSASYVLVLVPKMGLTLRLWCFYHSSTSVDT